MIKEIVKIETLKVSSIRAGTALPKMTDPGMDELQQSMKEHGLWMPLLVNEQHEIIDGVRRFVVAQTLGFASIDIMVADNYDAACDHIGLTRETEPHTAMPITIQRTHWFIEDLENLALRRRYERLQAMKGRPKATPYKDRGYHHKGPVRSVLQEALGLPSGTYVQAVKHLYKVASKPGPYQALASGLWAKMMAGETTLHSAYGTYRRTVEKMEKVNAAPDQRRTFTGMVPVIDALISSLQGMGDINPGITDQEANVWATKLRQLRKAVWITYTKLDNKPTKTDKGE